MLCGAVNGKTIRSACSKRLVKSLIKADKAGFQNCCQVLECTLNSKMIGSASHMYTSYSSSLVYRNRPAATHPATKETAASKTRHNLCFLVQTTVNCGSETMANVDAKLESWLAYKCSLNPLSFS